MGVNAGIRIRRSENWHARQRTTACLAAELVQRISRVKSVQSTGIRVGNWLSERRTQALLNAPDIMTVRGTQLRKRREHHSQKNQPVLNPAAECQRTMGAEPKCN